MDFIKYHGLGNDFILLRGGFRGAVSLTTDDVVRLCRRDTGVGADGILVARPSSVADLRMEIQNADGSVPEMCGNGIRCLVRYAIDELGLDAQPLRVDTGAGVLDCHWTRSGEHVTSVRVAMGPCLFDRSAIPMDGDGEAVAVPVRISDQEFSATGVSLGNPHMVLFSDEPEALIHAWGPALTTHPLWREGANVEGVRIESPIHLEVFVWERGCGPTRACGTGATAAAAAAVKHGHCPRDAAITVTLPGGDLEIEVAGDYSQSWMTGPAQEVYRGTV